VPKAARNIRALRVLQQAAGWGYSVTRDEELIEFYLSDQR